MLYACFCAKVITLSVFYNKTSFKLHTTDNNYVQAAIHIKGRMAKLYLLTVIIPLMLLVNVCPKVITLSVFYNKTSFNR
jgi:hypothetical protein